VAEGTVLGTDPLLAKLRQHLTVARAQGQDFTEAWADGRRQLLGGLTRWEHGVYQAALASTREAWARAYERQPSDRVDWAVAELEGYASDGELDRLHPAA
jgi:hypothetical protein